LTITVRPEYARWFQPLARFAEHRPRTALATVILALAAAFGAGVGLGLMLR
jgi:hypothetical protein